jgi:hypothetical protein
MEQRFFESISDEEQQRRSDAINALCRDAAGALPSDEGKDRKAIKGSYARNLTARLRAVETKR